MALVVEEDEPAGPVGVAVLGPAGVVADAQHLTDLVEQAWRPWAREFAEIDAEDLAVEKLQGLPGGFDGHQGRRLGLGDVLQEAADLGPRQFARVALAVKEDVAPRPGHVALGDLRLGEKLRGKDFS